MRHLVAFAFVAAVGAGCSHGHDNTTLAPDVMVTSTAGTQVALADAWKGHAHGVVVFYRGYY